MENQENDPVLKEIDTFMDEISAACDRLEDCLELNPADIGSTSPPHGDEPHSHSGFSEGPGDVIISGCGGSSFNLFPAPPGSCHDTMLVLLPRNPYPRQMGLCEAQAYHEVYFQHAAESIFHWAERCKGRTLVFFADAWPLPLIPPQASLGLSDRSYGPRIWRMTRRSRFQRRIHDDEVFDAHTLHALIGRILRKYRISCHIHLFIDKGHRVSLGTFNATDWPAGW